MFKQTLLIPTFIILFFPVTSNAQVVPDASVGSIVAPNQLINGILSERIDGGAKSGSNLFHSFSELNIDTGKNVYFSNPTDVINIFTRVTGNNASNINGTLGVLGDANLFLMNPNGIVFGASGKLDVKGSFLGTTATSINFADGIQYSAASNQANPLLTVSVPVGLGFGSNPGAIRVNGAGHNLGYQQLPGQAFPPFQRQTNPSGLAVKPGKTLALVGGDISLEGGQLLAEKGRVELGSVAGGNVNLVSTSTGFGLSYATVSEFRDIALSQKSLLDASESSGDGGIYVSGKQISLTDGSLGLIQTGTSQAPGGMIAVNASELIKLTGATTDGKIRSQLTSETTTSAASGKIQVSTKDLVFLEGGQVSTRTFATGKGGDAVINASNSIIADGSALSNPRFFSGAFLTVNGRTATGGAGNLTISSKQFSASNGALFSTASFGGGAGGNFVLNAEDINISGKDPVFGGPTDLRVGSSGVGNGGSLIVNTQRLTLQEGARINATTTGSGNAGSVTINASELVDVRGGTITSSAVFADVRTITNGYESIPTGKAGGIKISSDRLLVRDGGIVTVTNNGPTNAGILEISASSVLLDNKGSLSATTKLGEGGNIFLNADTLIMRRSSTITTNAGGSGNGGNIYLDAKAITQLENSDITANAVQGRGGNININTQGIFRSNDSDINATSEVGVNGEVNITTLDVKQDSSLREQASNFVNTDNIVASSCLNTRNQQQGRFVVSGNGGVAENPSDFNLDYELMQVKPVASISNKLSVAPTILTASTWKVGNPITEATLLVHTASGKILLQPANTVSNNIDSDSLICHM
jgi:filamentous hemagglutinin family protein